jgi:hypothetical protein
MKRGITGGSARAHSSARIVPKVFTSITLAGRARSSSWVGVSAAPEMTCVKSSPCIELSWRQDASCVTSPSKKASRPLRTCARRNACTYAHPRVHGPGRSKLRESAAARVSTRRRQGWPSSSSPPPPPLAGRSTQTSAARVGRWPLAAHLLIPHAGQIEDHSGSRRLHRQPPVDDRAEHEAGATRHQQPANRHCTVLLCRPAPPPRAGRAWHTSSAAASIDRVAQPPQI